jgi:DNA primase
MVAIDVVETSGVDHPAHLREGWLVKKAATQADIDTLFGDINKQKEVEPVADVTPTGPSQEEYDALVAKNADLEKANAELVAKAAEAPAPAEDAQEALLKSVPQEVRDMIAKAEADTAAARAEIAKERDARLDAEAVTFSKAAFTSLSFDHEVVAPALRRLALQDADVAKAVTDVLKAAEGQLESAGIFAEIGKSGADTGEDSLTKAVNALRAADANLTESAAIAKAVEADPSLYTAYLEGK